MPNNRQLTFSCATSELATELLTEDVSQTLKLRQTRRFGAPVAVVTGFVGIFADVNSTSPYIFQRSTYSYQTGSTNYDNRGQYKTHSDLGREELCFDAKYINYVDDGADLFDYTLNSLVPIANVKTKTGLVQYAREPFASVYRSQGKTVSGTLPPNTTSGYERAHDVQTMYGGFVAFATNYPGTLSDVLLTP